jgi:type I restriction enzyme M protein
LSKYWTLFPSLKDILFKPLREGFYTSALPKGEISHTVYTDGEFSAYADILDEATEGWKSAVWDKLVGIDKDTDIKGLIASLSEELLRQFEPVTLLDKYDVYQVLLAYWNDVMADDAYIIKPGGYTAARDTVNIIGEYASGKKKGQEKVVGWEGKLIPRQVIRDYYFQTEQKSIADTENVITAKEAELAELIENAEDNAIASKTLNDKGELVKGKLKAEMKKFKGKEDSDDYQELLALVELQEKIDEFSKLLKQMTKELEEKEQAKYPTLTDDEIIELLVNQKWYGAIVQGVEQLYRSASQRIAARVTELAERYEHTLPEIQSEIADLEQSVKSHLERMGFAW